METKSSPAHGNCISDYRVIQVLGKGSHSVVHEVTCLKCGSNHALKRVSQKRLREKNFAILLANEMHVHNSLRHERIVKLLQCFEDNDYIYLLTELCRGGELNRLVKSGKKLKIDRVRKIFHQIVEGVKYLHDNMIIHRDLKLANIMLTEQGDIKIGDFGLAVQLKNFSEERETICGTPNYMSPEILREELYNFETDVWSLGCILYALLVGRPPFEGPNMKGTVLNVKRGKFDIPEGVPADAKDLIRKLLKFKREERISVSDILRHSFFADIASPQPQKLHISEQIPASYPNAYEKADEENKKGRANAAHRKHCNRRTPILRNLSTERLKPITHATPQGCIKIDKSGIVEIELASKARVVQISANGQRILVKPKVVDGCVLEFNLSTLPKQFASIYKYAYDFVNILKSKTPKVILRGDDYKCYLMENEPLHNVEFAKRDGTKACYQMSSSTITITLPDKAQLQVNPYKEFDSLSEEMKALVEELFEAARQCEEVEKWAESKGKDFPILASTSN